MSEEKKSSVLKTLIIVVGAIIAVVVIGFIVLVAIELISPGEEAVVQPSEELVETLKVEEPAESVSDNNIFSEPGYGYSVKYPEGWIYELGENNSVIFSGPEGTDEFYTTVTFQTLFSKELGGNYDSLNELYLEMYNQFEQADGVFDFYEENAHFYNETTYPTISFDVVYSMGGETFWQYVILIERDQNAYHSVSYTSPLEHIELSVDKFIEMFESLKFVSIQ